MNRINSAVDSFFPQVVQGKQNSDVVEETVEIEEFCDSVVEHLKRIGPTNIANYWWTDVELMKLFSDLHKSGILPLPADPVDRIRWIALLCLECANESDFDASQIILLLDFLPEDMAEIFKSEYDPYVYQEIFDLRNMLAKIGWDGVFGS